MNKLRFLRFILLEGLKRDVVVDVDERTERKEDVMRTEEGRGGGKEGLWK